MNLSAKYDCSNSIIIYVPDLPHLKKCLLAIYAPPVQKCPKNVILDMLLCVSYSVFRTDFKSGIENCKFG